MESHALNRQLEDCIETMKHEVKPHGGCAAHWPIHNALRLLLECEHANMRERMEERDAKIAEKKKVRAEVISLSIAAATIVTSILCAIIKSH